jgi:hypothetical protein
VGVLGRFLGVSNLIFVTLFKMSYVDCVRGAAQTSGAPLAIPGGKGSLIINRAGGNA